MATVEATFIIARVFGCEACLANISDLLDAIISPGSLRSPLSFELLYTLTVIQILYMLVHCRIKLFTLGIYIDVCVLQ